VFRQGIDQDGIWKLSDTEYTKLRENSLPIKDYNFAVNYYLG